MSTRAVASVLRARDHRRQLSAIYPWTKSPLIVGAPMRIMSGPEFAVEVSRAGGLGFIGPGAKPEASSDLLEQARDIIKDLAGDAFASAKNLPVGVGFQTWNGDLEAAAAAVAAHKPCAAWLFAPRNGQSELDTWTRRFRELSPTTQIWIQVGTLQEALEASRSSAAPDVLVIQGAEAGGHGRASDGMGLISLLPEIADTLAESNICLVAAGGIADGRGCAGVLGLGAAAAVMGTRFLASKEVRISKGYQDEVVRATDAAKSTARTHLYNHLRGTFGWPEHWSPRTITNRSWQDYQNNVPFEELKRRHDEAVQLGDAAWGPEGRTATYAGASVGLVRDVNAAGDIVRSVREDAEEILSSLRA